VDLLTVFTVFAPILLALALATLVSVDPPVLKLLIALDNCPLLLKLLINVVSVVEMANLASDVMENCTVSSTMLVVSVVETDLLASTLAQTLLTATPALKTVIVDGVETLVPMDSASRETQVLLTEDALLPSSTNALSSLTLSLSELLLVVVSLLPSSSVLLQR
jgi:hypothetical protein